VGTSVSHRSPRTLGWKTASLGYSDRAIPQERVINEMWRASTAQANPIPQRLDSEIVFKCQEAVRRAGSVGQALHNVTTELIRSKQNSIITEIAKRAVPAAFRAENPVREWRNLLMVEMTDYLLSRDISGYVGGSHRNKTVAELIEFKRSVRDKVYRAVANVTIDPSSTAEWTQYIKATILKLTKTTP
jgi:hypothetical protein